jgi:putative hydrolase of HD superfamily
MKPDLARLIDLQKLLLQFQAIDRVLYIPGRGHRHENDIEHSYNLAMAAWFLAEYFPELNKDQVIRLSLVHDLVEVHAGDTFIFHNPTGMATKAAREAAALKQLSKDWADFPDMLRALHRYEERQSPEARFVYALDKVMPAIMNYLQGGEVWRQRHVSLQDLRDMKDSKVALSPEIQPYYHELLRLLESNLELFGAPPQST